MDRDSTLVQQLPDLADVALVASFDKRPEIETEMISQGSGLHSTEVAYLLLTHGHGFDSQYSQKNSEEELLMWVAEVNQRRWLKKSA